MKIKSFVDRVARSSIVFSVVAVAALVLLSGCETTNTQHAGNYPGSIQSSIQNSNDLVLREADTLRIVFPGADQLNTTDIIRRDGKITLPVIGEVVAVGKTPANFQKELAELYSKQLVSSKDISVVVVSSTFPVFVTGAVVRPGKVVTDHPLTVLESIMESGGFVDKTANLKAVKVVRTQNGKTHNYTVNLKGVLTGSPVDSFYLQPSDIVYVPFKTVWF